MSQYDDADNGSGTLVYGGYWLPAEPNAYKWMIGAEMRKEGINFLVCGSCLAYCDAMDVIVGDFAELHCVFCGADEIHINLDEGE